MAAAWSSAESACPTMDEDAAKTLVDGALLRSAQECRSARDLVVVPRPELALAVEMRSRAMANGHHHGCW